MRRGSVAGRRRTNEKPRDPRRNSRTLANHGRSAANHELRRASRKARLRLAGVQRDAGGTDIAGGGRRTYLSVRGVAACPGDVTGVDHRRRKQCEKGHKCPPASPAFYASGLDGHSLRLDADEFRFRSAIFSWFVLSIGGSTGTSPSPVHKRRAPLVYPFPKLRRYRRASNSR